MRRRKIRRAQVERTLQNPARTYESWGELADEGVTTVGNTVFVYYVERAVDEALVLSVKRRRSAPKKEGENLEDRADKEYDLLYLELHAGDTKRTEDLINGVHLDLDAEDQVVRAESLSLDAFDGLVKHRDLPANPIEWLCDEADLR